MGTTYSGSRVESIAPPRRVRGTWRPEPRTVLVLLLAAGAMVLLGMPDQVQAAATAACTAGEPSGTTCGQALVRLGYP